MLATSAAQFNTLLTAIGTLVMVGAWIVVGGHAKSGGQPLIRLVKLLDHYLVFMALYLVLAWLPYTALAIMPQSFATAAAWGYLLSHVCLYVACIQAARLTCELVPRTRRLEQLIVGAGVVLAGVLTVGGAIALLGGPGRPQYNYNEHLIQLNAPLWLNLGASLFALVAFLPVAIMLLRTAQTASGARRTRAGLLGGGLLLQAAASPLHEFAAIWTAYAAADGMMIAGAVTLAAGVLYRINHDLASSSQPSPQ